jgi:DNA-directed RNA polymerase subunit RPC12/RpoP
MTRPLNPACHYIVHNEPANLTRGIFNSLRGRFLLYEGRVNPEDVQIRISPCDCDAEGCNAGFFVTEAELDKAGGVIACEYCGRELLPFMYSWGTR